jgi:membrane protease YdiL (CAAX protease family)
MVVMDSHTHTGADSSPVGAVIRVTVAFVVFSVTLVAVGLVISRVPTPDVVANLPNQIATLCGVAAVVFVSARAFDVSPAAYGLKMNRRWISDLLGGIAIGVLFQAVSTAAIVGTGVGTVVDRWSTGAFDGPATLVAALGATVLAFFIIALWEDLLFRGVLIRESVVGLASRGVSQTVATGTAVVVSALLFGALHVNAGAAGLSTAVVVLQAVVGGLYFGLAYVLTDSLALPIGIHFSTNLWTTVVFGQPDSGFPAAFRLTRPIDLGVELIVVLFVPVGILVAAVFAWIRATRGEIPDASLGATT